MRELAAARLKSVEEARTAGNAFYKEGNLLEAYNQYSTSQRGAKSLQYSALWANDGDEAGAKEQVACAVANAVALGNMAAVTHNVSHGLTIEYVQGALNALRYTMSTPPMCSPAAVPLAFLGGCDPLSASNPVRWDLFAKFCQRRWAAYTHFGAFTNLIAEGAFCGIVTGAQRSQAAYDPPTPLVEALIAIKGYRSTQTLVRCGHPTPKEAAGLHHLQATCHPFSDLDRLLPDSLLWFWCALEPIDDKPGQVWLIAAEKRSGGKTKVYRLEVSWNGDAEEYEMTATETHAPQGALGAATLHASVGHIKDRPFMVGGAEPWMRHKDGGEMARGMAVQWAPGEPRNSGDKEAKSGPPHLTRHTGVVYPVFGQPNFFVYGGTVLSGTSGEERGSSNGHVWRHDLERASWHLCSPEGSQGPMPRQGHVSWVWMNYMMVYGGSHNVDGDSVTMSDLWAFDMLGKRWTEVATKGIVPSGRCDMGLAVADSGSRVYIVGGRTYVRLAIDPSHAEKDPETYTEGITAEVFELDLGEHPLDPSPGAGTARWRQVVPTKQGAAWLSARASLACHHFSMNGKEQILCVGGELVEEKWMKASSSAMLLEIQPKPSSRTYEADCEARLLKELGNLSGKAAAGLSKSDSKAAQESKAPRSSDKQQEGRKQPNTAQGQPKVIDKWPTKVVQLTDLIPVGGVYKMHFCSAIDPDNREREGYLLAANPDMFPTQGLRAISVRVSPASRTSIGPYAAHLGSCEIADSLGCNWLGFVNFCNDPTGPEFAYIKVARVFGTTLAAQEYFAATRNKYSLGHYDDHPQEGFVRTCRQEVRDGWPHTLASLDELHIQESTTVDLQTLGTYKNYVMIYCAGRVWLKVYCRRLLMPEEDMRGGTYPMRHVADMVSITRTYLRGTEPVCSRCEAPHSPQSPLKVCAGCQIVRFCEDCAPQAWREGHRTCCRQSWRLPSTPPDSIRGLPEEMLGFPLEKLLGGGSLQTVDAGLKARKSLLKLVDKRRLATFCGQIAHLEPWALVLCLQADKRAFTVLKSLRDCFLLCPYDLTCGGLKEFLMERFQVDTLSLTFGSQLGSIDQDTFVGDVYHKQGPICWLYYSDV